MIGCNEIMMHLFSNEAKILPMIEHDIRQILSHAPVDLSSCIYSILHHIFYKNSFIRTQASDFSKIKNNLRTTEPQIS